MRVADDVQFGELVGCDNRFRLGGHIEDNARGRVLEPPPINAHDIFVPDLPRLGQRIDDAAQHVGKDGAIGLQGLPEAFLRAVALRALCAGGLYVVRREMRIRERRKAERGSGAALSLLIIGAVLWGKPGPKQGVEENKAAGVDSNHASPR